MTNNHAVPEPTARTALFLGRFQPPSIAHAAMIETILRVYSTLIIGVLYDTSSVDTCGSVWKEYMRRAAEDFAPRKNPFSPEEIAQMWRAYLERRHLTEHVSVQITKRAMFEPNFNETFPPASIDLVSPGLNKSDSVKDNMRVNDFPRLLNRDLIVLEPPFKLHNTAIRGIITSGAATWSDFIPGGAYEIFIGLDGPRRMLSDTDTSP